MIYWEGLRRKQVWPNLCTMTSLLWREGIKKRKPQDNMYRNFQSHKTDAWPYANRDGSCKENLRIVVFTAKIRNTLYEPKPET